MKLKKVIHLFLSIIVILVSTHSCESSAENAPNTEIENKDTLAPIFTAWLNISDCKIAGIAGNINDGWMIACTKYQNRQEQYGILYHISPEGEINNSLTLRGRDIELRSILRLHDGNYLVAGTDSPSYKDKLLSEVNELEDLTDVETGEILSVTNDISAYFAVWKITPEGEVIWHQGYRNSGSETSDNFLCSAIEVSDNELVFIGSNMPKKGDYGISVLRTDGSGNQISDTVYFLFDNFLCDDAVISPTNEIFIGGTNNSINYASARIGLVIISEVGEVVLHQKYDEQVPELIHSFEKSFDGSIIIAGRTYDKEGNMKALLKKLDSEGNVLWSKEYDYSGFNTLGINGYGTIFTASNKILLEIDNEGNLVQEIKLEGMKIEEIALIKSIAENQILISGFASPNEKIKNSNQGKQGFITIIQR
jgi:hypothetical protein